MGRRRKNAPPAMREHTGKNLAYVVIDGKQIYLGPIGSPKAAKEYRKIVDQWERQFGVKPDALAVPGNVKIIDLVAAHHAWAMTHYRRKDGTTTTEVKDFMRALMPVLRSHKNDRPEEFRPLDLRKIVDQLVAKGLRRETVNKMARMIKRVWKWGASRELVSAEAAGALLMVRDLQSGRTPAPDYDEVLPVPLRDLARTLRHLSPVVAAMVRTQYYCGARPGEVCAMHADEIFKASFKVLRHNFLTRIDRFAGIAAGSSAVSHASVATTAIYVEADLSGAAKVADRFG